MSVQHEISQRDLRNRSGEIMDAVEHGETFTVTRSGSPIAQLVPLCRRHAVSRDQFAAVSANAPLIDSDRFRADLDDAFAGRLTILMADEVHGLLDTNILILRRAIDHAQLPDLMSISTITLAELSAGPHYATDPAERARRTDLLQRVESEFDPLPFGTEAARIFGRVSASVLAMGRTPRRRVADLMIASVAIAHRMPLYTTNPQDFEGLKELLDVVPVTRPAQAATEPRTGTAQAPAGAHAGKPG